MGTIGAEVVKKENIVKINGDFLYIKYSDSGRTLNI